MKIKSLILGTSLLASAFVMTSCQKDPDVWSAKTEKFCGEWVLTIDINELNATAMQGNYLISNTVENNENILLHIKDLFSDPANPDKAIQYFPAVANLETLTFSGERVQNGKIILNGVKVKPETLEAESILADSIYFEIPDEGDLIIFHGYRHTGWGD
ncbi:MAG: hypothetical protein II956_03570 [Bacteroidales bacterium]|nr:hypothetical protein [Bacteroidales bacterium]